MIVNSVIISIIVILILIIGFLGTLLYKERRAMDVQVSMIMKALLARNLQEFSLSTADQNIELQKIIEENKNARIAADLEQEDFDKRPVT